MQKTKYHRGIILGLCALLGACAMPAKKMDVMDMYQLPASTAANPAAQMPVDNDSYYIQPMIYKGCAQIGDAPSCAGGG